MENDSTAKRTHHAERIALSPESFSRVERWLSELRPQLRGSKINRSELVNWLISTRPDLTSTEIRDLTSRFFDPAKALEWATNVVKEAQKKGETVNLTDLLRETLQATTERKPKQASHSRASTTQS